MMSFGEKIKALRNERNLTQKSLAEQLSVTISTLSHWECDYQEPSLDALSKIADFFECSVDYLLAREDDFGNITISTPSTISLPPSEQGLLDNFRKLPTDLQHRATVYMEKLVELSTEETKTTFPPATAQGRKIVDKN